MKSMMDINCDCGESFGNYRMGQDEQMLPLVSSVNLACGFHAGDPVTMREAVDVAVANGCMIGAHPGLPDILGFGRRRMLITADDAYAYIVYQVGALQGMLRTRGLEIHHVKPHGALFAMLSTMPELGVAAANAVRDVAPNALVYWPLTSGDQFVVTLRECGFRVVGEIYPDLSYHDDGTIVVQRKKTHTDSKEAAEQVRRFVTSGCVQTIEGNMLPLEAESICLHGDDPNGVEIATEVRKVLDEHGCAVGLRS